jgi:hypothetical protein
VATTVIDTFILEFGLDPSKFTQGQKELLERMGQVRERGKTFGQDLESAGKKLSEVFSGMTRGALGLFGAFVSTFAVERVIEHITNLDAATLRLSRSINMDVRELSAWSSAAEQVGGTAEGMMGTLRSISGELNQFSITGKSNLMMTATALLGPLPSLAAAARGEVNPAEFIRDVTRRLDEMQVHGARRAGILQMLGFDRDTISLAMQGLKALDDAVEAARKAGTASKESGELAIEYGKQLEILKTAATDAGRALSVELLPWLTSGVTRLTEFFKALVGIRDTMKELKPVWEIPDWMKRFFEWWQAQSTPHPVTPGRTIESTPGKPARRAGGLFGSPEKDLNNPGKVMYGDLAKSFGATGEDPETGYAIFPSIEAGRAAAEAAARGSGMLPGGERILPFTGPTTELYPLGAGSRAFAMAGGMGGGGNSYSNSASIGQVVVNTQATDAYGIARDIKPALERLAFASHANYGLA